MNEMTPMLPEDRKHLDIAPIPEPGTRFWKDGVIWALAATDIKRGIFEQPRLTLVFVPVGPVNPVNPV